MFSWFKDHRRREVLAAPFPADWEAVVRAAVPPYAALTATEQERLRDGLRLLLAEKHWEGAGGLTLTDPMRVTVAAQASLLILGLSLEDYDGVESVFLYPTTYTATEQTVNARGIVTETPSVRAGQATGWGTIVLSWADVLTGLRAPQDGYNPVLHEFAHALDFRNPAAPGVPRLHRDAEYDDWASVMSDEFAALTRDLQEGRPTLLRDYAATDPAEFFAVATECFFERARDMAGEKPGLYRVLRDYYRQDPAAWPA